MDGYSFHISYPNNKAPLHFAVSTSDDGDTHIISLLLQHKANAVTNSGDTVLDIACYRNATETVKALLQAGISTQSKQLVHYFLNGDNRPKKKKSYAKKEIKYDSEEEKPAKTTKKKYASSSDSEEEKPKKKYPAKKYDSYKEDKKEEKSSKDKKDTKKYALETENIDMEVETEDLIDLLIKVNYDFGYVDSKGKPTNFRGKFSQRRTYTSFNCGEK